MIACLTRFRLIDWLVLILAAVALCTDGLAVVPFQIEYRIKFVLFLIILLQIVSFRWLECLLNQSVEKTAEPPSLKSNIPTLLSNGGIPEIILEDGPRGEEGITVLIGVRNRASSRLKNLLASLRRQTYSRDKITIIVIDYDSDTSYNHAYKLLCQEFDADLYRINYRAVWCKAEAINCGLRTVKTQYSMIADVDLIYAPNYVESAINALKEDPYRIVHSVVYETGLDVLNERADFEADFYKTLKSASPRSSDDRSSRYIYGLGIIAVCTDFLLHMHGLDEHYYGWGCEDDDLIQRLRMMGLHMHSIADKAVYLHHSHEKFEGLSKEEREQTAANTLYLRTSQGIIRNITSWNRPERSPIAQVGPPSGAKEFVLQQKRKLISVIIPVFDNVGLLKRCLEALKAQTFPSEAFEIVVVNNGALENIETLLNTYPRCRYVYEPKPGSYAARNAGVALAQGEIVAFTDADCLPKPDWLEKGHRYFFGPHKASYVAGHIKLRPNDALARTLAEEYQILFSFNQEYNWSVVGFGATANLFVRRSVLEQVGRFNSSLFSAGDRDFGERIKSLGVRSVYANDVIVEHPTTPELAALLTRSMRYIGGDFDLQRMKGRNKTNVVFNLLLREISSLLFFPMRVWKSPISYSLSTQLGIVAIGVAIRLARCWELLRLSVGGVSRRS